MKKFYLCLAGSINILGLIFQITSVLAQISQSSTIIPEPVATGEVSFTIDTTISKENSQTIELLEPTPVRSSPLAQTESVPQKQTVPIDTFNNPVTSTSQLSDVQPTDWAFQALQSLIKRYGIVAGYSDGTYQGNRVMTRYEFATGIYAVLEQVNQLTASGLATQISDQDLLILQRLRKEFATELTSLSDRVKTIESHTAQLEANQFSTTTKLTGLLVAAVATGGFSGDRIIDPTGAEITNENPDATVVYRASLNLNTSFSGTDMLLVRLEMGSARGRDNAAGFLEPNFGSAVDFSLRSAIDEEVQLARLQYTFTPFNDFTVTFGPTLSVQDYLDQNSYANRGYFDFTSLVFNNNLIALPFLDLGGGVVINWNPNSGPFTVRAGYLAPRAAAPNPSRQGSASGSPLINLLYPNGDSSNGLFGSPNQTSVELEYTPSKTFALRLLYSHGNVFDNQFDAFGVNLELALLEQLAVFGRYGYASYNDTIFGDIHPNYWMAGIAFRDLFKPGALAGIAAAQPFIDTKVGSATQTNVEVFYNLPLSDNIRITPAIQIITNPANQESNGTIITGTLRTSLFF
ncbi:iron uptake porin [Anabaena subtropica]|uniref:Carbohydrate porin n=1 Tax=Anabaena subtropica FACHB-260 TaxID=2692884 RepID=A0ABR8CPC7_9NOST|nr:iron uptake porin [Anabaena subtropica]MBD2344330.1 carbohydrate porin [Anabaena subtropica FACHB-260]